jgi:hypothetical protein
MEREQLSSGPEMRGIRAIGDLASAMLQRYAARAEAAARITWTITEKALGISDTGPR